MNNNIWIGLDWIGLDWIGLRIAVRSKTLPLGAWVFVLGAWGVFRDGSGDVQHECPPHAGGEIWHAKTDRKGVS